MNRIGINHASTLSELVPVFPNTVPVKLDAIMSTRA